MTLYAGIFSSFPFFVFGAAGYLWQLISTNLSKLAKYSLSAIIWSDKAINSLEDSFLNCFRASNKNSIASNSKMKSQNMSENIQVYVDREYSMSDTSSKFESNG